MGFLIIIQEAKSFLEFKRSEYSILFIGYFNMLLLKIILKHILYTQLLQSLMQLLLKVALETVIIECKEYLNATGC
jgi:hypothetical protein